MICRVRWRTWLEGRRTTYKADRSDCGNDTDKLRFLLVVVGGKTEPDNENEGGSVERDGVVLTDVTGPSNCKLAAIG